MSSNTRGRSRAAAMEYVLVGKKGTLKVSEAFSSSERDQPRGLSSAGRAVRKAAGSRLEMAPKAARKACVPVLGLAAVDSQPQLRLEFLVFLNRLEPAF